MATISLTSFVTLVLLFSATLVITEVNAQKRCQEVLYNSGCNLEDCRAKCYQKHQSIQGGQCIANPSMTDYSCVCVYNCNN
ncbi:unnamed protein product [Dovyalis caffra]|uniref:Uncharacterized protein n=1 Tax=Dovyalis caffra TaxID=77055 RepID=A0AAV1RR42_9ROSI|nr:unnamed protein product [Dovyalis caffra]